jgi:hypothetical protein
VWLTEIGRDRLLQARDRVAPVERQVSAAVADGDGGPLVRLLSRIGRSVEATLASGGGTDLGTSNHPLVHPVGEPVGDLGEPPSGRLHLGDVTEIPEEPPAPRGMPRQLRLGERDRNETIPTSVK